MKIERRTDGTLALTESLGVLRWILLLAALAAIGSSAAVALGLVDAELAERERWVLGGVALVCVAVALWAPITEIEIAPWRGHVRWRRTRLGGAHDRLIPFAEVLRVDVIEQRTRDERGKPRVTHRIVLGTATGPIPLSVVHMRSAQEAAALAEEIRGKIGLTRASGDDAAGDAGGDAGDLEARVRELIAAGRKIDAIALVREERGVGLVEAERWVRPRESS